MPSSENHPLCFDDHTKDCPENCPLYDAMVLARTKIIADIGLKETTNKIKKIRGRSRKKRILTVTEMQSITAEARSVAELEYSKFRSGQSSYSDTIQGIINRTRNNYGTRKDVCVFESK